MPPAAHPIFPVEISLDQCIKCNICTTVCPVSAVTDRFLGPKYEGPQAARYRQPGGPSPDASVDYCSGCRACNLACPTGVKIAEMNARARAGMVDDGRMPPLRRLRNNLIARSELVGKLAGPIAAPANAALNFAPLRTLMEWTLGIARHAPFPRLSRERFSQWFKRHTPAYPGPAAGDRPQVAYFHGCAAEYYEMRVAIAAVTVLEMNGFEVILPPQNCCGLPLLSNGEFAAAAGYHRANVRKLLPYARQGIPIIGASTSCTLTLKEEAPELLDLHDDDTQLVARHVYDLNEFLLELYDLGRFNLSLQPLPLHLPYHIPCQYRGHRLGHPGVEVLGLIPRLRITESEATCCGIAGTYGFKVEKYDIAMQVGAPLFDFLAAFAASPSSAPSADSHALSSAPSASSADSLVFSPASAAHIPPSTLLVICDSETCRWQITHATGLPAIHPVELLAAAYGRPTPASPAAALSSAPSADLSPK